MKILLLGGTGAMGVHLASVMSKRGDEVYVTTRQKRATTGIHFLQGNAHDIDFIKHILIQKWDAIVDFMVYSTEELKERAKLLLSSTTQYVFISSSRVYAQNDNPIIEDSPLLLDTVKDDAYLSTDEYALKKAREERILKASGNNFTIVRPYITFSEQRLQLGDLEKEDWLFRALDGRAIVLSEDIANHITTLTYGLDVANGIAALIGEKKAIGETIHITTSETMKWSDVLKVYLDTICEVTGNRPKVHYIKNSLKLKEKETKYQVLYDRRYDRVFDNAKIKNLASGLEFSPVVKCLKQCVTAFIRDGQFQKVSYLLEAERDRITGDTIPLSKIKENRDKVIYIACRYFGLAWMLRIILIFRKKQK